MGERVEDEALIAADVQTVWEVITDLPRYPEWAEGVRSVEVLATNDAGYPHQGRFVVDARVAEFTYTIQYVYEDHDVRWHLVEGETISQLDGRYALETVDVGTRVRFALEVDVDLPLPGFLKKRAAKAILDQGLTGLKRRAESAD